MLLGWYKKGNEEGGECKLFTLDNVDRVSNNILVPLMTSQNLFKCLKYPSADALSKPDLTDDEKVVLFNQIGDTKATRILFTPFNLNIEDTARTEMRIFVRRFRPDNLKLINVEVVIQVVAHNLIWRLDNGRQRLLVMVSEILKLLNNTDIGFVGNLEFVKDINISQYNSQFSGYELYPSVRSI